MVVALPVSPRLEQAIALHRAGAFQQAEAIYQEILATNSAHPDALNLLGAIALQTKSLHRAVELFGRAIDIDPGNLVAWCNRGLAYAQLGQFDAALQSYDQAIALKADVAEAHFSRGDILRSMGRLEAALTSYRQAIELEPDYAEAHLSSADVLRELKQFDAALASYEQAAELVPEFEQAHFRRGTLLHQLKRLDAALASYERAVALKPDYAEAHFKRGNALAQLAKLDAALASYERAIALQPDYAEAYCNRGNVLVQLKQLDAALSSCELAIAHKPNYAEAYSCRGYALAQLKQFDAALVSYQQAIALKPNDAEAHSHRGYAFAQLKQFDAALASYEQAIALKPDYAEVHLLRGLALRERRQWDAALASYEQAIAFKPDYAEAHANRGVILADLEQFDAALASLDRAIALKSDCAEAYAARSMVLLLLGDFGRGWADYEWRRQMKDKSLEYSFVQPLWLGQESIAGKTILLHSEQGLGDTLQFCRYARLIAARGARVILEVQKPLIALLSGLEGVTQVLATGEAPPAFDYQCALMSLPLACGTDLDCIPSSVRYLSADANKISKWQTRLAKAAKARVGLVWSGSAVHKGDRERSVDLSELIRHLPVGPQYVSLQKDLRASDRQLLQSADILQYADELNDFSDTAALCECLDLVISVDTSVAHLSGALGRKTWVLLPAVPDWRWLLNRDDSPWYPSIKLYRQRSRGDWSGVLEHVQADLIQAVGECDAG